MLFQPDDEDAEILPFTDRAEAGRSLAAKLTAYSGRSDVVVLGIARGGVVVAFEVAQALHAPLDVFVVRKLGVPWFKELGMGALAPGGVRLVDLSVAGDLSVSEQEIDEVVSAELQELQRRQQSYRQHRQEVPLLGKTVILVDDGVATGNSVLAAIRALRQCCVERVIVGIPVAALSCCAAIRMEADDLICIAQPESFMAISQWYEDFAEIGDDDVCALLDKANTFTARAA